MREGRRLRQAVEGSAADLVTTCVSELAEGRGEGTLGAAPTARAATRRLMRLPLAHRFRLAWRLARHPRVSLRARLALAALLCYLALPLDLIPDPIPVLGQIDDLVVTGLAVWWLLRVCPPAVILAEVERLERTPLGPAAARLPAALTLIGLLLLATALILVAR